MRGKVAFAVAAILVACTAGLLAATDTGTPTMSTSGHLSRNETILESSKLSDLAVYNDQGIKLGKIDNLIIDAHTGQVMYGVLSTGLFGKYVPVPWSALRLSKAADKDQFSFLLNLSKDQLGNAPTYDSKNRPDFTDQQWRATVNTFFGIRTVAKPMQSD